MRPNHISSSSHHHMDEFLVAHNMALHKSSPEVRAVSMTYANDVQLEGILGKVTPHVESSRSWSRDLRSGRNRGIIYKHVVLCSCSCSLFFNLTSPCNFQSLEGSSPAILRVYSHGECSGCFDATAHPTCHRRIYYSYATKQELWIPHPHPHTHPTPRHFKWKSEMSYSTKKCRFKGKLHRIRTFQSAPFEPCVRWANSISKLLSQWPPFDFASKAKKA